MDMKKIGQFLAELRKGNNLTQEQLGERLGVTNKTVSRWENGNYLPPAENLQSLSELYGITINEILSGQRLSDADYRTKAEDNIKSALDQSAFTLKEKIEYYKKKWRREHRSSIVVAVMVYIALHILGWNNDSMLLQLLATIFLVGIYIWRHNAMMIYVERRAFDPPTVEENAAENAPDMVMKRIRVTALILLGLAVWVCTDLGYNFFSALVPEINDGLTIRGAWAMLIFGRDGIHWTLENYFRGFAASAKIAAGLGIGNIMLACLDIDKGRK